MTFKDEINIIPDEEKPCINSILLEWEKTRPLINKKILINCHITVATLMLVNLLLISGADITVTCTEELVSHQSTKEILSDIGIYLSSQELPKEKYINYFDIVIDCGAYLSKILQPNISFIELTHVEESRYYKTNCPVVSIDSSFIKKIETCFGTGDGFVRSIKKIYENKCEDYRKKRYMIFGYGKVGEGICHSLCYSGVNKNKISVVEINQERLKAAKKHGYLSYDMYRSKDHLRDFLRHSVNCSITATGISGVISRFFSLADFQGVEYLANMGTYDEWGAEFPESRILHGKRPLNFTLEFPTKVLYLDPIFALLALTTENVIKLPPNKKLSILRPSMKLQEKVFLTWVNYHQTINPIQLNFSYIKKMWGKEKEASYA